MHVILDGLISSIDFAYVCEPPLKMQVAPLKNQ